MILCLKLIKWGSFISIINFKCNYYVNTWQVIWWTKPKRKNKPSNCCWLCKEIFKIVREEVWLNNRFTVQTCALIVTKYLVLHGLHHHIYTLNKYITISSSSSLISSSLSSSSPSLSLSLLSSASSSSSPF